MIAVFGLFILIGATAGLVFNTVTIALPKIVDERIGSGISLVAVGGIATAVFLCGAIAQLTVGRLVEKYPAALSCSPFTGLMQFVGVVWVVYATGYALLAALAFAMAFVYAQVTVNDIVIARYTADAWRGRVYAVRYFLTYRDLRRRDLDDRVPAQPRRLRSGADGRPRSIALGFVIGTAGVALLVNGVERDAQGGAAGRIASSEQRRREIVDARAGALVHDLGDAAAVAAVLVALVAEQAHRLARFHDRDEFVHRLDRLRRLEVLGVDAPERVELAARARPAGPRPACRASADADRRCRSRRVRRQAGAWRSRAGARPRPRGCRPGA